jgi:hypothetical protein
MSVGAALNRHLRQSGACTVRSLAPLLRGEGWGEGLLRYANSENVLIAVPGPSPEILAQREFRPLPVKDGERLGGPERADVNESRLDTGGPAYHFFA